MFCGVAATVSQDTAASLTSYMCFMHSHASFLKTKQPPAAGTEVGVQGGLAPPVVFCMT